MLRLLQFYLDGQNFHRILTIQKSHIKIRGRKRHIYKIDTVYQYKRSCLPNVGSCSIYTSLRYKSHTIYTILATSWQDESASHILRWGASLSATSSPKRDSVRYSFPKSCNKITNDHLSFSQYDIADRYNARI